ncbi:MAG: hypothetical protein BroJett024_43330 [Alphaproteobacteria bacterium]|nr:MAG: hypothetical protein BroJett024_43330 [Alphaproteobacteria bacterium]
MSRAEGEPEDERAEPLPAPIPGPEFKRLSRRQSVAAWTLGSIIGLALAAAVITIVLFLI